MPKKLIKRLMPNHDRIRSHKHLKVFGTLLHAPNLFHLNRRSASGAFAVGLFCAFVPLPGQMIMAAAAAILLRVNLPLSVALVWLTNPITVPPMFYGAYRLGAWLMGREFHEIESELSMEWLAGEMGQIWEPLLLGSLILGTLSAIIGYLTIRGLWRLHIISHLKERKLRRAERKVNRES
jgi:uncharacterized protein (DUF2062 family)